MNTTNANSERQIRPLIKRISFWLWAGLTLFFMILWLSSYTHSSSMGIDHDLWVEGRPVHTINHLYWPANGSLWVGSVGYEIDGIYERLDPAAAFFMGPLEYIESSNLLEKIGFWLILHADGADSLSGVNWAVWVGIPAWLPVVGLLFGPCLFAGKRWGHSTSWVSQSAVS